MATVKVGGADELEVGGKGNWKGNCKHGDGGRRRRWTRRGPCEFPGAVTWRKQLLCDATSSSAFHDQVLNAICTRWVLQGGHL